MFNRGRIKELEAALAEASSRIERYENAVAAAAQLMSAKESNALEALVLEFGDSIPETVRPMLTCTVEVWDMKQVGVGNQVSEFGQSLGYALQEFIVNPNVTDISKRTELLEYVLGKGHIYADVHKIVFSAVSKCELEVCCGSVHALLDQAFQSTKAKVSTEKFSRSSGTASFKVRVG